MSQFTRPADLPFPHTYYKFKAKDLNSDEFVEFKIQDILEKDFENAVALMASDYSPEESFSRCRGIPGNPEAFKEVQNLWRENLKRKISVGCYKNDGSEELVGANILDVYVKDAPEIPKSAIKTQHVRDLLSLLRYIEGQHEVYSIYNASMFLTDFGLVTKKAYRGRGIATEFLKARVFILQAFNVPVTSTVFTVIGSQKAALKAGYKEVLAVKWTDLADKFPQFDFTKADTEYCKIIDMTL